MWTSPPGRAPCLHSPLSQSWFCFQYPWQLNFPFSHFKSIVTLQTQRALSEVTLIYDYVALSWLFVSLPACLSVRLPFCLSPDISQEPNVTRQWQKHGAPDRRGSCPFRAPRGEGVTEQHIRSMCTERRQPQWLWEPREWEQSQIWGLQRLPKLTYEK